MIQTAAIVPGSESPAGEGSTGAARCTIILPDGSRRAAVVKRGPIGQIAAEAFAAVLLRAWGLPVPQPFLVEDDPHPAFASADDGYPSLKQQLGLHHMPPGEHRRRAEWVACRIAVGLRTAPLAAAADEAIANRDRNLGNILWDGASEAWIDHAYALGQADIPDANKLCDMARAVGASEQLLRSAVAQALALSRDAIALAAQDLPEHLGAHALASLVSQRIANVASALLSRFPAPDDLFSASQ
jgi:hypothetical protein